MPSGFWRAFALALRWPVAGFVGITGLAGSILWLTIPVRPVPINVQWNAGVTESQRVSLEQRFHLTAGRPIDRSTWSYTLADVSAANIRAIVQHDSVDATGLVNRSRFRPAFAFDRSRRIVLFAVALGGVCAILLGVRGAKSALGILVDVTPRTLDVVTAGPPLLLLAPIVAVLMMAAVGWQPWRENAAMTLPRAAAAADRVLVSRMMQKGADPNAAGPVALEERPDAVLTPLEAAVVSRNLPTVTLLEKMGARVNADNRTRLACLAADVGARDIVEYLQFGRDARASGASCAGIHLPAH